MIADGNFHTYKLDIVNNVGTVSIDGNVVLSNIPPDMTQTQFNIPEGVYWGGGYGSVTDLAYFCYKTGTPPSITSLTATPSVLWPPNHKKVSVSLNIASAGDPFPTCQISSVVSSEPSTKPGDVEWVITGPLSLSLEADRAGSGPGRAYTVAVTCTNGVSPDATDTVIVSVPHDQRK